MVRMVESDRAGVSSGVPTSRRLLRVSLEIPPACQDAIDEWRRRQLKLQPRNAALRTMIRQALERDGIKVPEDEGSEPAPPPRGKASRTRLKKR